MVAEEAQDAAPVVVEKNMGAAEVVAPTRAEPSEYPADQFTANLPTWRKHIEAGNKTADQIIAMVSSKASLSEEQKAEIRAPFQPAHIDNDGVIDAEFVNAMESQA